MNFLRNFEFSARSAKMKRSMSFSDMFVCCAAFCAFTFVCDCICLRSCYIVLLSCFLSFVVLPVSFYSDFTLLPVLCLIRAPSQSSRLVFAWPRLALICHVLFCSCRFRLPLRVAFSLRFLRVVFCKSLLLSRRSALRVSPAETRLTVYRRLSIYDLNRETIGWL